MIAVAAMVVDCNDEASIYSRFGKSRVAIAVLTKAVNDLDDASCLLSRRPELHMNLMPVFGIQRQAFVLWPTHPYSVREHADADDDRGHCAC